MPIQRQARRAEVMPRRTALACAATLLLPLPAGAEARGVSDPVVSWGLSSIADWTTAMPFLDLAHVMRPFFAFSDGEWEVRSHDDLRAEGVFDEVGYPRRIPEGTSGLRTVWAWNGETGGSARAGLYILSYSGRGQLQLGGDAEVLNAVGNRIVFQAGGGSFWLDITATAPDDPIRAISIVRAEDFALAEAGALFNPDWLSIVADARELRFMDWMQTNNATSGTWSDRPRPSDATWTAHGAPVEIMVRLANEAGVDPWFTLPHLADDDYIRAFATYVRDNLDPRLKAHVEYSNEIWNGAFVQNRWLHDQAVAEWGDEVSDDYEAILAYHTKRATHVALLWQEVFGDAADSRLVNVLGTQAGATWVTQTGLEAAAWQEREPDAFRPPSSVFDELAATTYFGGEFVANPDLRREILATAREQGDYAYPWLYNRLALADDAVDTIPGTIASLTEQRDLAHANGLRFTLYEGGQHIHHSFAINDLTESQTKDLTVFLGGFVRSPEMAALYSLLWDGWRQIGDGPFMQFTEMDAPSQWGSWGVLGWPGDSTPRSRFILSKQAEGGSWWGEGGGPQYLQGLTASGTEGADRMEGTDEEDFLAGLGGGDIFVASPGRDGINGGAGNDTYLLPGQPDAYSIAPEGAGYRVEGPEGSAFLIHVEAIEFGDGSRRELD